MISMYDELIKRLREAPSDWPDAELHYEAADAIEKLIEVIQNHDFLESLIKPDWIPVTERLPEDYEQVLTCDERGNIHLFRHLRQFIYPFGIRPEDPRYFMPKWWMPLPQPPESEVER